MEWRGPDLGIKSQEVRDTEVHVYGRNAISHASLQRSLQSTVDRKRCHTDHPSSTLGTTGDRHAERRRLIRKGMNIDS